MPTENIPVIDGYTPFSSFESCHVGTALPCIGTIVEMATEAEKQLATFPNAITRRNKIMAALDLIINMQDQTLKACSVFSILFTGLHHACYLSDYYRRADLLRDSAELARTALQLYLAHHSSGAVSARAGAMKSEARAAASRANGLKGGRPKQQA